MRRFTIASALGFGLASASFGQVFSDNFNRPDAADLGPNWQNVTTASATRTIGNQAGNVTGANNLSLVTTGNFSASYLQTSVSADIFHSGVVGTGYVVLAFGHNGGTALGNGLFIKVQTQGTATMFSNIGFYTGVGNGGTTPWSDPPVFFTPTSQFQSARMTIWASDATTVNLGLDTDFNGSFDQTYTRHMNLASMVFGTRVGIGVFGTNVKADNFSATAVPEPATMAVLGVGALALLRRRRKA